MNSNHTEAWQFSKVLPLIVLPYRGGGDEGKGGLIVHCTEILGNTPVTSSFNIALAFLGKRLYVT